jgi:protein-L-isoaspartate O-methyltransferase
LLDARRPGFDLFLLSALIVYLAQVSLWWFPERMVLLGRFPNVILVACFLGPALGCLAAGQAARLITGTPLCLALALTLATDAVMDRLTLYDSLAREVFGAVLFVLIALSLTGPGQELGRALDRAPSHVLGFALILLGGACGICLSAVCAYAELNPWYRFCVVAVGLTYFASMRLPGGSPLASGVRTANVGILAGILGLIGWACLPLPLPGAPAQAAFWSPYAPIYYDSPTASIYYSQSSQEMRSVKRLTPRDLQYLLPCLLNRDAGGRPFHRVLIIGAGAGNEVSRALHWGAEHVDAVELDPVLLRLGRDHHPDLPYQDSRVRTYLGDGRRFLRSCSQPYDLILYNFADVTIPSPGLHDIRRVNSLLTRQAFMDVRRCLGPHGMFVLIGRLREGRLAARLRQGLEEVFPEAPLLLPILYQPMIASDSADTRVLFFAGNIGHIRQAFQQSSLYHISRNFFPNIGDDNGFALPSSPWGRAGVFGPATAEASEYLDSAEDDWPFLFLRRRTLPDWVSRDLVVLATLAVVLLWIFRPASPFPPLDGGRPASPARPAGNWPPFRLEMFFLGTGFMLTAITTRVDAALLFGDTWTTEPIAGLIVLALLLAGLGLVLVLRPTRLWPSYAGLLLALLLHRLFPLDSFLGHDQTLSAVASYLLGLAPVLFAGMVFVLLVRRSPEPARDLGAVLAGAVLGGMAANLALVWGFRSLLLLAAGSFAVAAVPSARRALREYEWRHPIVRGPHRNRVGGRRLSHFGKR